MGFFGGFIFDGRDWQAFDPFSGARPELAEPWLSVVIYDSDIADIQYRPTGAGSGTAYLGHTPRGYFGDENASAPTDVSREAEGLASWLVQLHAGSDELQLQDLITSFLASDLVSDEDGDHGDGFVDNDADHDLADPFVEVKLARLLAAVGLPGPPGLPDPS